MAFEDFEPIYHFTTVESAIKILLSEQILFSKMDKVNDVNETFRPIYLEGKGSDNDFETVEYELGKYRQISFTLDRFKRDGKPGFLLGNMWGHYADSGNGVCLVFDKNEIMSLLKAHEYKDVTYKHHYDPSIVFRGLRNYQVDNVAKYIKYRTKGLFFTKADEWKSEQEFRVVRRFSEPIKSYDNKYLSFKGSNALKYLIMQNARDISNKDTVFSSANYEILKRCSDKPIFQLCKDLEGYHILYSENGNTFWFEGGSSSSIIGGRWSVNA